MKDNSGVIWMDGQFVPWGDAKVHVLTHTLHYGMGVFEGLRAYKTERGSAIFRLQAHVKRLINSAHILGLNMPFNAETIIQACIETVRRNKLESAYIRPMCFYGSESMGLRADHLKVHLMIATWSWESYLGKENLEKGIRVKTSSYSRHHINSTMCKAKANGNYLNSMLALQEAQICGCDEALLLDQHGYVAEGSGENIFLVSEGALLTPTLSSALQGITRDTLLLLAKEQGLQVMERNITRDEVYIADEAFFTGTAAEVVPIKELDWRSIGNGKRGPVTEKLQGLYFDLVHDRYQLENPWVNPKEEWLTYIN